MARFDIRHPFRSIANLIIGTPEQPAPPREKEYEPPGRIPVEFGPRGPFDNYEFDERRREIWSEVTGLSETNDSADKGWEIFGDSGAPTGHDYFETNELWDEFLRAFWLDTNDDGFILRSQYYEDAEITPVLIDWPEWREWRDTP